MRNFLQPELFSLSRVQATAKEVGGPVQDGYRRVEREGWTMVCAILLLQESPLRYPMKGFMGKEAIEIMSSMRQRMLRRRGPC